MKPLRFVAAAATLGAALLLSSLPARALELVIWHDKGDDGIQMFREIGELYRKENPDVTVRSLSFPTEQWFSRTIAAVNTNTAPDLLFNDNFRVARIQQSTGKLRDLSGDLNVVPEDARRHLAKGDIDASLYQGKLVMLPSQRVLVGLGARKSWLAKVGEPFPTTWADLLRVARKMQEGDPDGNGRADTYGMALQAGDASVLHQMLELFGFGAGLSHVAVNREGEVILDQPENARVITEHLKLYNTYKLVSPETRNHTFTDMYQLIEGGRVGFFRVGDWNVKKWDREGLKGDYEIGPLPTMFDGRKPSLVVHGIRSAAVPANGKNADAAAKFARFLLSREAQEVSMRRMGSAVRSDLKTDDLEPHQAFFAKASYPANPNDFPESIHPWYPQFKEALHKELMAAVASPPQDWNVWVKEAAGRLRIVAADLKKKP